MATTTPALASKSTISSRNKISSHLNHLNGFQDTVLTTQQNNTRMNKTSLMPPPSQIARNSVGLKTPAPPTSSRLTTSSGYSNFNTTMKNGKSSPTPSSTSSTHSTTTASSLHNKTISHLSHIASLRTATSSKSGAATSRKLIPPSVNAQSQNSYGVTRVNGHLASTTRLPLHTTGKIARKENTSTNRIGSISSTQSRILAPQSRLTQTSLIGSQLNSRSSSTMSTMSSLTTTTTTTTSRKPSTNSTSYALTADTSDSASHNNPVPSTNTTRKGLAKFSNPIECQRQFLALSLKIRQTNEILEAREKEIDLLEAKLKQAANAGVAYATTVQYFAAKLKLDSDMNLEDECKQLKFRVDQLMVNEREYESKLSDIVDDYKNHLQVELDLRNNIEKELEETRASNLKDLETLKEAHQNELSDLNEKHSTYVKELQNRIEHLESELEDKCADLVNLRKDYEVLTNNYNKLEESLTKDKDARVKYAQEKITQLQKDVDSLNSVLEMRLERIHSLEKDSLQLVEVQNELVSQKDLNKAMNQQLESVNAALEKRREQFESLFAEHEQLRQELTRERKERRRMTMKTEQLEYVLNESCASESNIVFNSSVKSVDGADHLV